MKISHISKKETPIPSKEELINQLGILNLTIDTLHVNLLAIILNIKFAKRKRAELLDLINETNFTEGLPDLSDIPIITNKMFIYSGLIFLGINNTAYKKLSSVEGENRNPKAIKIAWKARLSSLLSLIASLISSDNLEL